MSSPYRSTPEERVAPRRTLDPWSLALLFAWVCDLGRVAWGLLHQRPVTGELGFAAVLAVTTATVGAVWWRGRSARKTAGNQ